MSRDGNGNYTPPLNPVVGGQPIEADWANDTINDLAAALTDSLSRSGNGNMLAPFRATDGTITIPSIAFTNEPNSGLYRAGTGDYRLCVNGKDKARIRDVNGMAAFQVFDLAGTGAWETLATSAEVGAITLADVLAVGNTTGGTDIVVGDGDSIVFNAYVDDFCSIETNIVGPATNLDFQLGDDDGDAFRFKFDHFGAAGGYLDALKIKPDVNVVARDKFIVDVTGTVNAESLDVTGTVDCDGLRMDDGEYAGFGDSDDLQIFHNGANSYIQDSGTGQLVLNTTNGGGIYIESAGETMAQFVSNGTVNLYHDNAHKFATTATGIDVTGTVEADEFSGTGTVAITDFVTDVSTNDNDTTVPTTAAVKSYVDTAGGKETLAETLALGNTTGGTDLSVSAADDLLLTDSSKIIASNGLTGADKRELQIYVDGTSNGISKIVAADNFLTIQSETYVQLGGTGGFPIVKATDDTASLYHGTGAVNNAVKLATTATGIDVTGTISTDTGLLVTTVSNEPALETTGELRLASSNTKSVSMGVNGAGNFYVNNTGVPSLGTGTTSGQFSVGLKVNDDNVLCFRPLKFNALSIEISKFSSDGTFASPSNTELPTTQAVKTYVDNAAFPTTTNNAADIAYTAFNTFSGKRIINTASSTATTYGLPTPVAADVGKSWVICNPTDSEITIDHDASGTANYIWIMDGVTLAAAASSWTIKKGAIVEIVVVASASGGGSATAPNYLIFGAGLLEIV